MRWGTERRLEFIEFRVFWDGGINRSDLTERFGVSVPQASTDLSLYQKLAPDNLAYDASEKRYTASPAFAPQFLNPSADAYLAQLRSVAEELIDPMDTWLQRVPSIDAMPIPIRRIEPPVLQSILDVMRSGRSIEINYLSMNVVRTGEMWRRITPHAFGFDGVRWHVRAFCHIDERFKDFVLSRCSATREPGPAGAHSEVDRDWNEHFEVQLIPNPNLGAAQQRTVAFDYAMSEDGIRLPVRRALLYYFYRRLGLDYITLDADPNRSPLVVANREELMKALRLNVK
ncbi:WYL domain-containing protein [Robbsia andropogonis]|uniref:WYL domain-containing protein n=1 Tax=Robbsia andropogonis TaxID=28092 RepID=UPI000565E777|nr:WYL domain-containing protein [Robbsia andropogonis]